MTATIDLLRKPAADFTIDDLESLCANQAEESIVLEFKEDLPTPKDARGWRAGSNLHRAESRELGKEIVAFANTRGGRIIVGIEESEDHPKRAIRLSSPLPRLAELVERLRDALAALIDRPLQGLQVVGLEADEEGSGYLIIDVPASLRAPHGVGRPPECYWRRDSTSTPMEMTDLQNVFWEARAGRERIETEFGDGRIRLREYLSDNPGLSYRFTAVSERSLSLPRIAGDLRNGKVAPHSSSSSGVRVAEYPLWSLHEWRPNASGAQRDVDPLHARGRLSRWVVDENGLVEVVGAVAGTANSDGEVSSLVSPYWFAGTVADLLALLAYVNQYADGEAARWIVEGELLSAHLYDYAHIDDGWRDHRKVDLRRGARSSRLLIDLSEQVSQSFELLEDRIWASFGLDVRSRYPLPTQNGLIK